MAAGDCRETCSLATGSQRLVNRITRACERAGDIRYSRRVSAKKTSASKPATALASKTPPAEGAPAVARGKLIERSVAAKRARLAREARADIALVKRRRARIAEDFYDIGEALARLKRPGVPESLGYTTFAELCERELGMSLGKANYLIAVVTHVPRAEAARLGQDRTVALLELADATPEEDTVTELARGIVKLP